MNGPLRTLVLFQGPTLSQNTFEVKISCITTACDGVPLDLLDYISLHGILALPPVVEAYTSGQDMLKILLKMAENLAMENPLSLSSAERLHVMEMVV